jgi:hypothetical protein
VVERRSSGANLVTRALPHSAFVPSVAPGTPPASSLRVASRCFSLPPSCNHHSTLRMRFHLHTMLSDRILCHSLRNYMAPRYVPAQGIDGWFLSSALFNVGLRNVGHSGYECELLSSTYRCQKLRRFDAVHIMHHLGSSISNVQLRRTAGVHPHGS